MTGARRPGVRRRILSVLAAVSTCLALLPVASLAGPVAAVYAQSSWQAYQRDYHFQRLDDRNGLAQNSVSLIFQDRTGFMWFGTQGGLFRYDGYTLTRFTHDADRADSLPGGYRATALADAGHGLMRVGSASSGLTLLDPGADRTLPLPAAVGRPGVPITALLRLPNERILVATGRAVDLLTGGASAPSLRQSWRAPAAVPGELRAMTRCPDGAVYGYLGDAVVQLGPTQRLLATMGHPISALHCDPSDRLLLGAATGVTVIDRGTGAVAPIWSPPGGVAVTSIASDRDGRLWLAVPGQGLVRLQRDGTATRIEPAPVGIEGGLPDAPITTLFVDRTGLLWVGTVTSGVAWTRTVGSPIRAVLALGRDPAERSYVRAFQPAGAGDYWVALQRAGLVKYAPRTATVTSYGGALEAATRAPEAMRVAAIDPMVEQARGHMPHWLQALEPRDIFVGSILRNPDGTLLLASNHGLLDFNPASATATYAVLDGTSAVFPIRALLRDRAGDLWVAPFGMGLIHYHDGRSVQRLDAAHGLGSDTVLALAQDPGGRIWAGTNDGVSTIDPATGRIHTFRESPGNPHSLAGNTVASLLVDRSGRVWIGTLSGLNRLTHLDGATATFQRYGQRNGLPDTTIDCLPEDADGHIWASTNLGLADLDPETGTVRSFGLADGTQGNEYNGGARARAGDDQLLFGGRGFDIVNTARLEASSPPLQVAFTSIRAGANALPMAQSAPVAIKLAAGERSLEASFSAFDYALSAQSRYRYRLLGRGHGHWIGPTYAHLAAWNDLRPGSYRLEVQALRRDGSPGSSAELRVDAATAWWWSVPMRIVYAATVVLLVLILLMGWRSHYLEQVRHRSQLRLRESRLRQALWGSGDEFWDWNLATGTILRLGPEGAPGGHHEVSINADEWRTRMLHPDDLPAFNRALAEHVAGNTEHFEVEHRVRNGNGDWTWVISRGRIVERDAEGKALRICGTERDISARRAADRDRRIASEVIRNMSEAVAVTDLDFHFVSVNTAFTRMTGYADHEVIGRDASVLNGSRHSPESYSQIRQTLTETGHWRGELWQRRKDGAEFLCWVELNEVCDAAGQRTHMIAVLTDITDRKRAEQELRYLANYDTLTGLPNRALLGERLGSAVINARRTGQKVGLLFLDLDRFKHINDSLGHLAGDLTLKSAGARLRQCVRETDVVARLGGDEFTVVLDSLADVRGAEEMAQRLIRAFARPLRLSATQEAVISPSIGIAVYPDHGQTPADLLKCADTAMYQAKEGGRNTWTVYHAGMDTRARDHATLVTALRRALERQELRMVYQPKLDIRGGRGITGMEALLRWHNPELGEIPPSTFIPLAEESGQIHDLSAFVFATACADLRRFRERGHRSLTMAINLSAAQLNRPDLTLHICDTLAEHDIAPNRIELELTESMVMANAEQSVRLLGELKAVGARLAIDDFGTGYSSLAYLKRLPIDTLKIDQEFVGDITTDPDDAAITSTIITMAHSLQLRVVAEGVETEAQLAFLRTQGCDEIQGYWLARPLSADACLAFLDRHAVAVVPTS